MQIETSCFPTLITTSTSILPRIHNGKKCPAHLPSYGYHPRPADIFTSGSHSLKREKNVNLLWVRESGLYLRISGKKCRKMLWVWEMGLCLQLSFQRESEHHLRRWSSPGWTTRVKTRQSKLYFGRWRGAGGQRLKSTISYTRRGPDAWGRVAHPASTSSQLPPNRLSDWQVWPAG